ncbi:MAG: penicillin-binding protein activator LpoB [Opitutales bacterium]|nr:penicillin-binding protein activator LpoB [Opitutales bacterium]MCH8540164.1 penicillin-binding protein activator LpoB [Opitutales bacterium]
MKFQKLFSLSGLALLSTALLFTSGCRSTEYVDADGPRTIVTRDINIQDWAQAADEMVQSMVESGVLERAPELPAVMAVSQIVNDTSESVNIERLTGRLRASLNRTGKIVTATTIGLGDVPDDPLAQREAQRRSAERPEVFWTLSGVIMEDNVRTRRTAQTTYIFILRLTEVDSQLALWEDERRITKQESRGFLGIF